MSSPLVIAVEMIEDDFFNDCDRSRRRSNEKCSGGIRFHSTLPSLCLSSDEDDQTANFSDSSTLEKSPKPIVITTELNEEKDMNNASNRQPLVPVDDIGINNNSTFQGTVDKSTDHTASIYKLSWFSNAFCAATESLTYDSINQLGRNVDDELCSDGNDFITSDLLSTSQNLVDTDDGNECQLGLNIDKLESNCDPDNDMFSDDEKSAVSTVQTQVSESCQLTLESHGSFDAYFGQNNVFCHSLENWYLELESEEKSGVETELYYIYNDRSPRNSSVNPIARKKKIDDLIQNLEPFEINQSHLKQGSINMDKYCPAEHRTIRFSFSNATPKPTRVKTPPKKDSSLNAALRGECSTFADTTCGTLGDAHHNLNIVVTKDEATLSDKNEELFYDSDPSNLTSKKRSALEYKRSSISRRRIKRVDFNINDEVTCLEKVITVLTINHLNDSYLVFHDNALIPTLMFTPPIPLDS